MRVPERSPVRPPVRGGARPHAAAPPPVPRHPLIALQQHVGNHAVQRHVLGPVVRREAGDDKPTVDEQAKRWLREKLAEQNRVIASRFRVIEGSLSRDERDQKVPVVRAVHQAFAATGVLTLVMVDTLYRALQPAKMPDLVDRDFYYFREEVRLRDEMTEGLNDPFAYKMKYLYSGIDAVRPPPPGSR